MDIEKIFGLITKQIAATGAPVTYRQVWSFAYPGQPWNGIHCLREVMIILGELTQHCIDKKLPILSAAVVRQDTNDATDTAKSNLHEGCRELGLDRAKDVSKEKFFADEQRKALIRWGS